MSKNTAEGDLRKERKDYQLDELQRNRLHADPFIEFGHWMQTARDHQLIDATAMTLATATATGIPSARIVLLKQFDANGFCWYTNYDSRKGLELRTNKHAALLFYWRELERQVRIEGVVEQVPEAQSTDYFNSRPAGSKFSAAASPQSQVVPDQQWLANEARRLQVKFTTDKLPRPAHWGGYCLTPVTFEFWQGRPSRLHDRFRYTRKDNQTRKENADGNGSLEWAIDRLGP